MEPENVETVENDIDLTGTVEGLNDLTQKVDVLVEVLEQQAEEEVLTPEEIQAEEQLAAEQLVQAEQQTEEELLFREELLLVMGDVKTSLTNLNENTLALIEKTETNNSVVADVAPYAKQASEWLLIALVVMFLLWVVKQFEDMFNAAFR